MITPSHNVVSNLAAYELLRICTWTTLHPAQPRVSQLKSPHLPPPSGGTASSGSRMGRDGGHQMMVSTRWWLSFISEELWGAYFQGPNAITGRTGKISLKGPFPWAGGSKAGRQVTGSREWAVPLGWLAAELQNFCLRVASQDPTLRGRAEPVGTFQVSPERQHAKQDMAANLTSTHLPCVRTCLGVRNS